MATNRSPRSLRVDRARRIGIAEQNVEGLLGVLEPGRSIPRTPGGSAARLLFKGGTSLSKRSGLISRFSEDIDITVFRQDLDLGDSLSIDELENLSGKKRQAKLDDIRAACRSYLQRELLPALQERLLETC